jgi:hypothetical protein
VEKEIEDLSKLVSDEIDNVDLSARSKRAIKISGAITFIL